jgi:hypothetical protein
MLRNVEWLRTKAGIDQQSLKARLRQELETEVASGRLPREALNVFGVKYAVRP